MDSPYYLEFVSRETVASRVRQAERDAAARRARRAGKHVAAGRSGAAGRGPWLAVPRALGAALRLARRVMPSAAG